MIFVIVNMYCCVIWMLVGGKSIMNVIGVWGLLFG